MLAFTVAILLFIILALLFVNSAEAISILTGINPVGALAAACTAAVGLLWLVKTSK